MKLLHGSLFSGIGGLDLGFELAGFKAAWQVEREPFCQAILKTRFPKAELFNDVREVGKKNLSRVHVITGGFPCQDLSTAGKRAGLRASRSGLFFEARRIIAEMRPAWFVLENVPGLLSSKQGADFRTVIEALAKCGYGLAWRILDSQYFGVAQRRRRVFVVGRLGRPCPAEVLFERPRSCRRPAEIREAQDSSAGAASSSIGSRGVECLESGQANAAVGFEQCTNLTCLHEAPIIASALTLCRTYALNNKGRKRKRKDAPGVDDQMCRADVSSAAIDAHRVREFAGLPEGLDSARYRALGNAVTVPVAYWIAQRINRATHLLPLNTDSPRCSG